MKIEVDDNAAITACLLTICLMLCFFAKSCTTYQLEELRIKHPTTQAVK